MSKLKRATPSICVWSEDDDGGPWSTGCERLFEINEGRPSENGMKFCCFCGQPLEEVPFEYEDESDDHPQTG